MSLGMRPGGNGQHWEWSLGMRLGNAMLEWSLGMRLGNAMLEWSLGMRLGNAMLEWSLGTKLVVKGNAVSGGW